MSDSVCALSYGTLCAGIAPGKTSKRQWYARGQLQHLTVFSKSSDANFAWKSFSTFNIKSKGHFWKMIVMWSVSPCLLDRNSFYQQYACTFPWEWSAHTLHVLLVVVYWHTHTHTHMDIYTYARTRMHAYTHTLTHTHIRAHTHTHTLSLSLSCMHRERERRTHLRARTYTCIRMVSKCYEQIQQKYGFIKALYFFSP